MQICNSLCRFVQIRKSARICTLSARCLRAVCALSAHCLRLSAHRLQKSACLTCVHTCWPVVQQLLVVSSVTHVAAQIICVCVLFMGDSKHGWGTGGENNSVLVAKQPIVRAASTG